MRCYSTADVYQYDDRPSGGGKSASSDRMRAFRASSTARRARRQVHLHRAGRETAGRPTCREASRSGHPDLHSQPIQISPSRQARERQSVVAFHAAMLKICHAAQRGEGQCCASIALLRPSPSQPILNTPCCYIGPG